MFKLASISAADPDVDVFSFQAVSEIISYACAVCLFSERRSDLT